MDVFKNYNLSIDNPFFEINKCLKATCDNADNIGELYMDTYLNKPYMLLSRVIEQRIYPSFVDKRLIFKKKDNTVLVNILIDDIEDYVIKRYDDCRYQIVFTLHKIVYKILIIFK